MSHISFIEYSHNPEHITLKEVSERLRSLGFSQMTVNTHSGVTSWVSLHALVMVRASDDVETGGITGVGVVADFDALNEHADFHMDDDLGMLVTQDQYDNRLVVIPDDQRNLVETRANYERVENITGYIKPLVTNYRGIIQECNSDQHLTFLNDMGFNPGFRSDRYLVKLDQDYVAWVLRTHSDSGRITGTIMETDNIFDLIPKLISMGVTMSPVDPERIPRTFGELTHLVVGYRCAALGNEDSYIIERRACEVLPGWDWIIQMRAGKVHLKTELLDQHYGCDPD